MTVRIGRTLPPAVAPIGFLNIVNGIMAIFLGNGAVRAFAVQLKEYFSVKHCFLLSSGKASLALVLQALKEEYPDRDEVLIPAFTCYSVPAAIVRAGLKIRICDVDPVTLDFDYRELAEQLSCPRVLCVIPTHFFGVTADVTRVRNLIAGRKIVIIEDAAQVIGGERDGNKAGTLGDVGLFSLGRGKAFSTVSGGVIITNSDEIGALLNRQCDALPGISRFGQLVLSLYAVVLAVLSRPSLFWIPQSLPFLGLGETAFNPDFSVERLSPFQAALAVEWPVRIRELQSIRRKNADYFRSSGVAAAIDAEALSSGVIRYPHYVSSATQKRIILHESGRLGLGAADTYPGTVDSIGKLQGSIVGGASGKAKSIVERMVTFPVHPYVTEVNVKKIAALLHLLDRT